MAPRSRRRPVAVVCSAPNPAAHLTVVHVDADSCTLSTGELLIVRWDKLRALCEQVCQERCDIWIRTWMSSDGNELIELHRAGASVTDVTMASTSDFEAF